jgi:hypothetical protein
MVRLQNLLGRATVKGLPDVYMRGTNFFAWINYHLNCKELPPVLQTKPSTEEKVKLKNVNNIWIAIPNGNPSSTG